MPEDPLDLDITQFVELVNLLPPDMIKISIVRWFEMRDLDVPRSWIDYFIELGV